MVVDARLNALGIVWMIASSLMALLGVAFGLMFMGFGGLATSLPDTNTGEPAPMWVGLLFGGMGLVFCGIFVVMGLLGFIAGHKARQGRTWALFVLVILGFSQLSSVPLGTALGIWTMAVVIPILAKPKS